MELGIYQKKAQPKTNKQDTKSRIKDLKDKINVAKIFYYAVIFFASRASIFISLMPFGAAMYAVEFTGGIPFLAAGVVLAGTVLQGFGIVAVIKYAAGMLLFTAVARKTDIKRSVPKKAAVMALSVVMTGMIPYIVSGILFYDVMMLVLEGIVIFACVCIFDRAKKLIFTSKTRETASSEDIVSITALAAITIMGVGEIEIKGIGISGCLCVLAALLFAYENGAVIGAASGVTIGLIYGLYSDNIVGALGAFALASMLAGFFSKYGRSGSAIGFLFANSLITFYAIGTRAVMVGLGEIAIASLVFTLLPQKFAVIFDLTGEKRKSHSAKMKEFTYMSLMENSRAISEIADIYSNISENRLLGTQGAASSFFEKTARKLCEDCSLRGHCWRKEFNRTYTAFFVMLEICGRKGYVDSNDIPYELKTKCKKRDEIVGVFNNMYEIYKVDKLWETRVTEGRNLTAMQMKCISEQIERLAKMSKGGFSFDVSLENNIKAKLNENNIPVSSVLVCTGGKGAKIDVTVRGKADDTDKMEKIISECAGGEYKKLIRVGDKIRFFKKDGLRVFVGKVREAKDNNAYNGDSTECTYLENGKFMMILSDGMGSGEKASADSRATVEIAKRLLKCGFDAESTIAMVNSVLVLKSAETSFASVDLGLIDLCKSEMDFYKLGAAHSFIKRGTDVKIISSASLPAGVFGETDVDRAKVKLAKGDAVIMVSDGVVGNRSGEELTEIISSYKGTNPQEMAGKILKSAKEMQANIVTDDMTVVVAMIDEAIA